MTARRPSATALSALEMTHQPCVTTRSFPGPWATDLPLGGSVAMSYELRSSGGQAQSAGIDRYWLQGLLHGRKPRRCTIRAAGELDLAAVDQLRAALNQQCESGPCLLRLDLSA